MTTRGAAILAVIVAVFVFVPAASAQAQPAHPWPSLSPRARSIPARSIAPWGAARLGLIDLMVALMPHERRLALAPELTGGATLSGHVLDVAGGGMAADVGWSTLVDGVISEGSGASAGDGSYTLGGLPGASGTGSVWITGNANGDSAYPYWLGHVQQSWPDPGTTSYDLRTGAFSTNLKDGGPWSDDWTSALLTLEGQDGQGGIVSQTVAGGQFPRALPGIYTRAAVNFYANEGTEIRTRLSVAPVLGASIGGVIGLLGVSFVDASHGWAIDGNAVYRTSDGGATWSRHTTGIPSDPWLRGIEFVDEKDGWLACQSGLFVSVDGGETWSQQTAPCSSVHSVQFTDAAHGWVTADSNKLLRTADGGQTWTVVGTLPGGMRRMVFVDPLHGWATTQSGIYATDDGGVSWVSQYTCEAPGLAGIDFTDSLHGWAVGWSGLIVATTDGGSTWRRQRSGQTEPDFMRVDFVDSLHGCAGGLDGTVATTDDGGATWVRRATGADTIDDLVMLDPTHIWGVAWWGPISTADGGVTWTTTVLRADEAKAQRLTVSSPFWASGKPGTRTRLRFEHYPAGWVSELSGRPSYPSTAAPRSFGSHTSKGGFRESKSLTIPASAEPGYSYVLDARHQDGLLDLEVPFQVCAFKSDKTSVRSGARVTLTGVVPVQGHEGSTAGIRKRVWVFKRTTAAGQPGAGDPTQRGWRYVGRFKTDGYGAFKLSQRLSRTTWYVALYDQDAWYWGAYTSVLKVRVR